MAATIHLPRASRRLLEAWTAQGYPDETCGLLVGRHDRDDTWVTRAELARNIDKERARDRFEVAPQDFLDCDRRAADEGLSVVGCWHSHPDHPARPSATDLARAWPDWSYVIVSVRGRRCEEMRSWRLNGNHFDEEVICSWEP